MAASSAIDGNRCRAITGSCVWSGMGRTGDIHSLHDKRCRYGDPALTWERHMVAIMEIVHGIYGNIFVIIPEPNLGMLGQPYTWSISSKNVIKKIHEIELMICP